MRLAFIGPVPPLRGGIAQHSAQLVRALRERGHRVDVLSWAAQYPAVLYPGRQLDPNARPFSGTRFAMRWWDPLTWWRAGRLARGADALLVTWVIPQQALPYRIIQAGTGGAPVIAVVHEPLPHEPTRLHRALTSAFLRNVDGALSHARTVTDELARLAPRVPVATTGHPPNLAIHRQALPPGPPWQLLFLGHLRPYKGVDVALAALRHLPEHVTLTVAGNPWKPAEEWRQRAAELGVADRVRFRFGYVPDDAIDALLAQHHVLVAPYVQAAQSGVIPLALAAGRPVVATDVGGLPEAVRDGHDGAVVAAGDPVAFAQGVRRVLGDLARMADAAASSGDDWDQVAAAVEGLVPRR